MYCMKCGREIEEDQVFCSFCLLDMEQHPVKPGTVILLPPQDSTPSKKPPRKKKQPLTPEEQAQYYKKRLWIYRIVSTLLILSVCALIYISGRMFTELDIQRLLGQNYSSITDVLDPESTDPS